jgi:hypothetical protein
METQNIIKLKTKMTSKNSALNLSGSKRLDLTTEEKMSIFSSERMNDYLARKFKPYKNPLHDRDCEVTLISRGCNSLSHSQLLEEITSFSFLDLNEKNIR